MMKYEAVVRAREGIRRLAADDEYRLLALFGTLAREPESWDEFLEALEPWGDEAAAWRAADEVPAWSALEWASRRDTGGCAVDLVSRSIAAYRWQPPDLCGGYTPDEDVHKPVEKARVVWINAPEGWALKQFAEASVPSWEEWLAERARASSPPPRLDARAILYGSPLFEFLAGEMHRAAATGAAAAAVEEDALAALTKKIHAAWLLTPRADLGEQTPRDVLLAKRHFLDMDETHRMHQWSVEKRPPKPLPRTSAAYRWAGFSTTEIALYFALVRALMARGWELLREQPALALDELIALLLEYRDRWLTVDSEEGEYPMPPGDMLEHARRRMPIVGHSLLDPDCPQCQALRDQGATPFFFGIDGYHLELENDFAFSLHSREEWEERQRELAVGEET